MESNGSNIQLQREFLSGFLVGGGFGTIFNPCFPLVKYFTKASFCGHHKLSNFQTVPNVRVDQKTSVSSKTSFQKKSLKIFQKKKLTTS